MLHLRVDYWCILLHAAFYCITADTLRGSCELYGHARVVSCDKPRFCRFIRCNVMHYGSIFQCNAREVQYRVEISGCGDSVQCNALDTEVQCVRRTIFSLHALQFALQCRRSIRLRYLEVVVQCNAMHLSVSQQCTVKWEVWNWDATIQILPLHFKCSYSM